MSLWTAIGAREAASALLLSDAVRRASNAYLNPLGVGVFDLSRDNFDEGRYLCLYLNALRVDPKYINEPRWIRLTDIPTIRDRLSSDFGDEASTFLKNGAAFVGPPPQMQAATGDIVLTRTSIGTLGAEVTWGSSYGFLTAGHVGGAVGSPAYTANQGLASQALGTVVYCQTGAGAGSQGAADVALIELPGKKPNPWAGKSRRVVVPLDKIQVQRNGTTVSDVVKGMYVWLAFPGTNIVLANTYMTASHITQQGDSGAVAIHSSSGDVVGHVVGGTISVASYIQEIDYQLRSITMYGVSQHAPISHIST